MDVTQVALYRREVLRRIVEYAWQDVLPEHGAAPDPGVKAT